MKTNKCHRCGRETETSVKITQIRGNQKTVVSLCQSCASEMGFHNPLDQMPFPLAKILEGIVDQSFSARELAVDGEACADCGMTFAQFSQFGRFGCGSCYKTFRQKLETILRKIHGNSIHRGRMPRTVDDSTVSVKEQERLESEYKRAIEHEEFERAADLRDRLREIRTQLSEALSKSEGGEN
ncbi:MAG: UvrB/UvrC motif-containing protein [Candidatus Zixiibacteriota bacterium]